eukprot:3769609-Alexandrium_andersonii.AAC.1
MTSARASLRRLRHDDSRDDFKAVALGALARLGMLAALAVAVARLVVLAAFAAIVLAARLVALAAPAL